MGLPTSAVDVCNMALDFIGQAQISSIEAPTRQSEIIVARHYDQVRRELLREWVWNFAYTLGTASLDTDIEIPFDYKNAYLLPNDCVRFISMEGDSEIDRATDYQISGRHIYYDGDDAASINVRYVRDVTDVTLWDDLFRKIVVLKLALNLCYPFSKSKSDTERINSLLTLELKGAISIDGQERPPRRREKSRVISARRLLNGGDGVAGQWTYVE